MTLSEFKAWFEGYMENVESEATSQQVKRVKAQAAAIGGEGTVGVSVEYGHADLQELVKKINEDLEDQRIRLS